MLGLKFENFRARFIHGFLENDSLNYNRYITARGIEWTNKNSLVIGVSEIVIYSGLSRPIDLAYINPISTHLEIELNNRQNKLGVSSANAVWQCSLDWMLNKNFRISGNLLIDEFVFDKIEIDSGRTHGLGFSFKSSWTPIKGENIIDIYSSLIYCGSNTFRHEIGSNNFVQRGSPIGYSLGSDFLLTNLGFQFYNMKNIFTNMEIGLIDNGSSSILQTPYQPYENYGGGKFPSGKINRKSYFKINLMYWIKQDILIDGEINYFVSNTEKNEFNIKIGFDKFFKF